MHDLYILRLPIDSKTLGGNQYGGANSIRLQVFTCKLYTTI